MKAFETDWTNLGVGAESRTRDHRVDHHVTGSGMALGAGIGLLGGGTGLSGVNLGRGGGLRTGGGAGEGFKLDMPKVKGQKYDLLSGQGPEKVMVRDDPGRFGQAWNAARKVGNRWGGVIRGAAGGLALGAGASGMLDEHEVGIFGNTGDETTRTQRTDEAGFERLQHLLKRKDLPIQTRGPLSDLMLETWLSARAKAGRRPSREDLLRTYLEKTSMMIDWQSQDR